jgi:hypothetical protein
MPAKSKESFKSIVTKKYGEKVANEIVGIIDTMSRKGKDPNEIQDKVNQYFLRRLKKDMDGALAKFDHVPTFTLRHIGR